MEITEVISFYLDENLKTLEVTFRTTLDSDEEVREDKIFLKEVSEFDYDFINSENDITSVLEEEYDEEFDFDDFGEIYVDHQEILSFLNEYYSIYPEKLPNSEIF